MIDNTSYLSEKRHPSNWRNSLNFFKGHDKGFCILVLANVRMDNLHVLSCFVKANSRNFDIFLALSSPSFYRAIWYFRQNLQTFHEEVLQHRWRRTHVEKIPCSIFHPVPTSLLYNHSPWPTHHVHYMGRKKH